MHHAAPSRSALTTAALALALTASACGIKEKVQQRVQEEVAEKVIEAAGGGDIDVETRDGKVSIKGKDGEEVHIDGEKGTLTVKDADGKVYDYAQDKDGNATLKGSDGLDAQMGQGEIPEDFPLKVPAKAVTLSHRVQSPDGTLAFQLAFESSAGDVEATAKLIQAAFEGKGMKVERTEVTGPEGKLINLAAVNEASKLQASGIVATERSDAGDKVNVLMTWTDTSNKKAG